MTILQCRHGLGPCGICGVGPVFDARLITLPDGSYFFHEEGWTVTRDIKGRGWKVTRIDGRDDAS